MTKFQISIICFFLASTLTVVLVWPKYQDLKSLQFQIEEKKAELQSREEYSLKIKEIFEKLEKYQDQLAKIDSALPSDPSLPSLFHFLQNLSSRSGLVLKEISPGAVQEFSPQPEFSPPEFSPPEFSPQPEFSLPEFSPPEFPPPQPQIKKIAINLTLSGPYSGFKNFLESLEKNSRLFEVSNISFSSPEEEEIFDFKLKIETHSY